MCPPFSQDIPQAKKVKTFVATTTTESGSPDQDAGDELTSKDYYFDSYSHFGVSYMYMYNVQYM